VFGNKIMKKTFKLMQEKVRGQRKVCGLFIWMPQGGFFWMKEWRMFVNNMYHRHSGRPPIDIPAILTHSVCGWKNNCKTLFWVIPTQNSMMANRQKIQLNGDFKLSQKPGNSHTHKILSLFHLQK
jgi:hypothetical protein